MPWADDKQWLDKHDRWWATWTADSLHYYDLSNHLVILSHFPSTNNKGPQEPQASREILSHSFWWDVIFFPIASIKWSHKSNILVNGTFTYTPWIVPQKKKMRGFLGRQICVGEVIIHPSWQDNRCSSQRTQPCLLGFGDLIFIVRLCYAYYILCLPQEYTHACGRKEHLWMDETKMCVRAQVGTNRGANTQQQQQVETNTQQPQTLKFPTVNSWFTQHASSANYCMYKSEKNKLCISIRQQVCVCLWVCHCGLWLRWSWQRQEVAEEWGGGEAEPDRKLPVHGCWSEGQ